MQISSPTIVGLAIVAMRAALCESAAVATILAAGIATMLVCQFLNWRGATATASNLHVLALTVMVSFPMWRGEGMRDSAMPAFPAVLVVAALLVRPRHFAGFAVRVVLGALRRLLSRIKVELERHRASQQNLADLSRHDALTQLPNRIQGPSRIERVIAVAQRNGGHVALLFVDLDNVKSVNDSRGHTTGGEYRGQVAQRLLGAVRKTADPRLSCRTGLRPGPGPGLPVCPADAGRAIRRLVVRKKLPAAPADPACRRRASAIIGA